MRVLAVGNLYPPHAPGGGYELTWRSAMEHLRDRGHAVRVGGPTTASRAWMPPRGPGRPPGTPPWYWRDHAFPRRGLA